MRDRRSEGAAPRAFRVSVDPLVIVGGVGKEVDIALRDLEPVAGAQEGYSKPHLSEKKNRARAASNDSR